MKTDLIIEKFWESVPPAWFQTRAHIRRAAAEQFNLTVEQFQVLRRIRRGFNSVSAIAKESHTSRPAVSAAVDGLVNRSLVTRQTDTVDRRHIQLSLTPEGERVLNGIYAETNRWLADKFSQLTPETHSQLLAALDLLQKTLNE